MEQLAKMQSAERTSNYFVPLIRNLLTVLALTLVTGSWLIIRARQRLGTGKTQQSGHFSWWEHVTSDHIHHHVHLECKL